MMGDFFTRLAERSLGLATQVRPDYPAALAPLVEGAGLGESFSESAAPGPAPRAPSELAPSSAITAAAAVTPLGEVKTMGAPTPPVDAQDQAGESRFTGDATVVTSPSVAERQLSDARRVSPLSRQDAAVTAAPVDAKSPLTVAPAQRQKAATGAVEVQLPSSSPSPQWRPAVTQPPPTVLVTIGRVEVRAVTPPPIVQQRPAERRVSARLSLEDYLRQRNEGRR